MLTYEQITKGIQVEMRKVATLVDELATAGDEAAEADATYGIKFAKARLTIRALATEKLTVGEVDDSALVECEGEYRHQLIAKNRHKTTLEALRSSQSRLDALRSLLSSLRTAGG